jgi:inorganic pyrophosphatase
MKLPGPYKKKKDRFNVIIETPYKSRNKFAYNKETGLFKLTKVLPAGMVFPCDMGFIPETLAEDGDPIDALILMDELTFPGCLVECRLIGAIKAEQTGKTGKTKRNDRFIMLPAEMQDENHITDISQINESKIKGIMDFFRNYNAFENKEFKVLEMLGTKAARKILKEYLG